MTEKSKLLKLQFYTRQDCSLCASALAVVRRVQQQIPFQIESIDIDGDSVARGRYGTVIPVVTAGPVELARSFIDEKKLLAAVKKLALKTA
jgi:hypothetical protein